MGNQCCASRKAPGCVFSESELERLGILYDDLVPNQSGKNHTLSLARLFPENPPLADLVTNFMKLNSTHGYMNYDVFESSLEVLIKEAAGYKLKKYLSFEKVDVLALVILGEGFISFEELATIPVRYDQACYYVETILRIFQHVEGKPSPIEVFAVKAVADGVFIRGQETLVTWAQFLEHIKRNLLYANRCLQFYFTTKFLQRPVRLRLPKVSRASAILTRDLLGLIYLSNTYLHPVDKMECLHLSHYAPTTFQSLAIALKMYSGPTLLLFRISVPGDSRIGSFVLGAFSLSQWKDSPSYQGNNGTHIFSLVPHFQMFLPMFRGTPEGNNFVFLNSSENANVGLGFGGDARNGYRLWIDGKDPSKSYIKAEDSTYRGGQLIVGHDGLINVDFVEVWGLGADLSLIADSTFEGSEIIERKQWITFNQSKIPQLSNGNPQIAKNLADFEAKIQSINQSTSYAGNDFRQGSQGAPMSYETPDKRPYPNTTDINASSYVVSLASVEHSAKPGETEKKSGYNRDFGGFEGRNTYNVPIRTEQPLLDDYSGRGRSTYTVTDGFYNPFKQRNEPIVRRMSQNDIAVQQQNQTRFETNTQW